MAASSKPAWSTIVTDRAGETVCSKEKKIWWLPRQAVGSWWWAKGQRSEART